MTARARRRAWLLDELSLVAICAVVGFVTWRVDDLHDSGLAFGVSLLLLAVLNCLQAWHYLGRPRQ